MKHYGFFRSSASYRLRIGTNLKGLAVDYVPVHLSKNGGEQHLADFVKLNPQHLVPVLEDGALRLFQSLAIIEYLEDAYPERPLLGITPAARAEARRLSQSSD